MSSGTQGPSSLVGQTIGGYRLERMLGKGATGAVFLGRRAETTPRVLERTNQPAVHLPDEAAIKVLILPWQLEDHERDDFRARFLREAQTLQRLRHPNILSVLDSGEDPATGVTYMILPYMRGGTLATRIAVAGATLPLADISTFLIQLAGALDYAHSRGVVHRDIKPANILLDDSGTPYLSDFSIVRLLSETQTRLTSTGRVMGTPEYMAPEQIDGREVGPAADIYGLGMVVYQLVTGRVAFSATSIVELIRLQTQEDPPPPRTLRPDLPEAAQAAILRALAKDPAQRFGTAVTFASTFSDGLANQWAPGLTAFAPGARLNPSDSTPTSSRTTLVQTPSTPSARRRVPVPVAVLSIALALLLTGSGLLYVARLGPFAPNTSLAAILSSPTLPGATVTGASATGTGGPATTIGPATTVGPGTPTSTTHTGPGPGPAATATPTPVPGPPVSVYGDGSDGPLTLYSSLVDTSPDAACTGTAGSTSLSFSSASGSFAPGRPVLIHQSRGAGAGTWMTNKILGITGSTLTLATPLNATYSPGAQVILLHQYSNVTVSAGVTWSAPPWDGTKGGILAFLANGTVTVNGTFAVNGLNGSNANGTDTSAPGGPGLGFRGGGSEPAGQDAYQGEGVNGTGALVTNANADGGGGGYESSNAGPNPYAGGGGGGNGTPGGDGGASNSSSIGGAHGSTAGTVDLSTMVFGGGGGGGAVYTGNHGGGGGGGGGIIYIAAAALSLGAGGAITALGGNGGTGDLGVGGGGGGAGGSIRLRTQSQSLGAGTLSVNGGSGGPNGGAAGGSGRIYVSS